MFQTNLQEIDAGLDVEETLDFVEDHGANVWLLNTGGIISNYPSALEFQTVNPFLAGRPSGDLVGDAIAAAHARGVRLVCRMDFSKIAPRIADAHPEWCFVSPSGGSQVYSGLVSVCPSAGYYQERMFDVFDEIIDNYDVDGFFINWFSFNETDYSRVYHGVCHCEACARGFEEYSGLGVLPDGPESPDYDTWLRFSHDVVAELSARLTAHLKERRPGVALMGGRSSDVTFHEAGNEVGREQWHLATSESVSARLVSNPGIPLVTNAVAFVDLPYRMAWAQPEHFTQFFVQTIARGGNPSTYIMGAPNRIAYPPIEPAAEVVKFRGRHLETYRGLTPYSKTALVQPSRLAQASTDYLAAVDEFRGLYAVLQERHVLFDVIAIDALDALARDGHLDRYRLLVLPDLGALSRATIASLDEFVRVGGSILATGSTAISSDDVVQSASLPGVLRVATVEGFQDLSSAYITDADDEEARAYAFTEAVLPVMGASHLLTWRPSADRRWSFLPRAPFGPPERAYGHVKSGHPGAVVDRFGAGTAASIPWTIGRTYREFATTGLRDFVEELVLELLDDAEQLAADLPEQIEWTAMRNGADVILHVNNLSGAKRQTFGPHIPISGGRIRVRGASGAEAAALVADVACATYREGDDVIVQLPTIELFEVIRLTVAGHQDQ